MEITGKRFTVTALGTRMTYLNQRSKEWTHPYEYPPTPGDTLTTAGCGIFSLCYVAQRLTGREIIPEALADFSCKEGGRGDDGTDRPMLLSAMQKKGLAKEYGFRYDGDGLVNDQEALWNVMREGGCALCNLRIGHIVALIACREQDGERQLLAMDSHSESADVRVRDFVREVVPGSEVNSPVVNAAGLTVGIAQSYGLFWVPLTLPRDVNLLHPANA